MAILSGKKLKSAKYRFWLQNGVKNLIRYAFLICDFEIAGFHLLFSTHNHFIKLKTEKRKIPFLVTKSNQKFNLTNFPDLGPPNSWLVNIILIENDF